VTIRLRILGRPEDGVRARIAAADVELVEQDGPPGLDAVFGWEPDVDAVLATLRAHPRLPWVHMRWAGIPRALLEGMAPYPTILTNGSGAHGPAMAESVLGMVLAHYKQHADLRAHQLRAEWAPRYLAELRGQTAGLVGLGDLGGAIAAALDALGVRVLGLRRQPRPTPHVAEVFGPTQLDAFLSRLDILVLAAPLTPETERLIGAAQLARLPRGALLVNVGRGQLVDEAALIDALRAGHLAGAALDVFDVEPLPPTSPLWTLPNVFISPHTADTTRQSEERGLAIFLDNLDRFRRGLPLRNVVDRTLGYARRADADP
jgi:phosphoglycerate dehydrogenase-like enzyme